MTKAFLIGFLAYSRGDYLESNPYIDDTEFYEDWVKGWFSASHLWIRFEDDE